MSHTIPTFGVPTTGSTPKITSGRPSRLVPTSAVPLAAARGRRMEERPPHECEGLPSVCRPDAAGYVLASSGVACRTSSIELFLRCTEESAPFGAQEVGRERGVIDDLYVELLPRWCRAAP